MTCQTVHVPDGGFAIACGPKLHTHKCAHCGARATLQCDYPVDKWYCNSNTCDKHLCAQCAVQAGIGVDYCPEHPVRRATQLSLVL